MQTVRIEKLVFGGQGLARLADGRVVFVWNALPGEEVELDIISNKKDFVEAVARQIITPSADRREPRDPHFLSSAPWDIVAPNKENEFKRDIAIEQYGKIGGLILQNNPPEIVGPDSHKSKIAEQPDTDNEIWYGYRNKIEFSFAPTNPNDPSNGPEYVPVSLAFFERGKKNRVAVEKSSLAEPVINETADRILDWINEQQIPLRSLKSLIVRSNGAGQAIAGLFLKDRLSFEQYPELNSAFLGLNIFYSTHKSPASVPTALLYQAGQDFLIANIKGTKLKFGLLSFFQINIPIFEIALDDIAAFIPPKSPLIDMYSGVGAISLPISYNREQTELVDNNKEAIELALENIEANRLANCTAACVPAEQITDIISKDKILMVDPPRAGLHEKLIRHILVRRPPRIVYMSCNIATHARDIRLLGEHYKISFLKLYNFFPRTPHIEGLCVLDRI